MEKEKMFLGRFTIKEMRIIHDALEGYIIAETNEAPPVTPEALAHFRKLLSRFAFPLKTKNWKLPTPGVTFGPGPYVQTRVGVGLEKDRAAMEHDALMSRIEKFGEPDNG